MSINEWEEGEIVIPSKEFVDVRRTVVRAHNATEEKSLELARRIHADLLEFTKRQRNVEWSRALWSMFDEQARTTRRVARNHSNDDVLYRATRLVEQGFREQGRPLSPQKKWLDLLPLAATEIDLGEVSVRFDATTRTVGWKVMENNHAVERARKHPVGKALFSRLKRVKWTRGSGGIIVGNDEYNCDSRDSGGGGNYISGSYGPIGQSEAGYLSA
ncbi:hypothetical protein CMK11_09565 [Candidatus Poribacteria bacterium]|nr:hypothetical protein [Candidatus Poribacteria bacterium]